MSQVPEVGQVWEVDLKNQFGWIQAIVLVLPPLEDDSIGLSGLNLLNGERIRLFMPYGHELPDAWGRIT